MNLAHDSKTKYKCRTACSSPRPFVSLVCFVVHSARQYLRSIPYDRPIRRAPSTRHHTAFPALPRLRTPNTGAASLTIQRARVLYFQEYFYLAAGFRHPAKSSVFPPPRTVGKNRKAPHIVYRYYEKNARPRDPSTAEPHTADPNSTSPEKRRHHFHIPLHRRSHQGRSGRPFTERVTGAWLRAKNRERDSRGSGSPGRIALHKRRPEGAGNNDVAAIAMLIVIVIVIIIGVLVLLSNPRATSSQPITSAPRTTHRESPVSETGKIQFSFQRAPIRSRSENAEKAPKTNSALHLRKERPPQRGSGVTNVQYHPFQVGRMTPEPGPRLSGPGMWLQAKSPNRKTFMQLISGVSRPYTVNAHVTERPLQQNATMLSAARPDRHRKDEQA